MLDLAFIREHSELIKDVARRRHAEVDVDALLAVDAELRGVRRRAEDLRAEQNHLSKVIREAGADQAARERAIAAGREVAAPSGVGDERSARRSTWGRYAPRAVTRSSERSTNAFWRRAKRRKWPWWPACTSC